MDSGKQAGFYVSEGLKEHGLKRFVPGREAESLRQSDAPMLGRNWVSGLLGPEPEHPT